MSRVTRRPRGNTGLAVGLALTGFALWTGLYLAFIAAVLLIVKAIFF